MNYYSGGNESHFDNGSFPFLDFLLDEEITLENYLSVRISKKRRETINVFLDHYDADLKYNDSVWIQGNIFDFFERHSFRMAAGQHLKRLDLPDGYEELKATFLLDMFLIGFGLNMEQINEVANSLVDKYLEIFEPYLVTIRPRGLGCMPPDEVLYNIIEGMLTSGAGCRIDIEGDQTEGVNGSDVDISQLNGSGNELKGVESQNDASSDFGAFGTFVENYLDMDGLDNNES